MDCLDVPKILPNSPNRARGQIQVNNVFRPRKDVIINVLLSCGLTVEGVSMLLKDINVFVSALMSAGHLWTDVLWQKVTIYSIKSHIVLNAEVIYDVHSVITA